MENFCCTKCGSVNVFIDDRGNQKALMCNDCQSWIKWISKKSLPFAKKFIEENKQNSNKNEWEEISNICQNAVDKKGLDKEQVKNITDNIFEEVKNEKEEIHKPDFYDFMGLVKDILAQVDDNNLDTTATRMKDTIDDLVTMEKRYAKVGLRVRKTFDEIVYDDKER